MHDHRAYEFSSAICMTILYLLYIGYLHVRRVCSFSVDYSHLQSTLNLTDSDLTDFAFNGLCPLADNQPRSGLKSVRVKESPVGGRA